MNIWIDKGDRLVPLKGMRMKAIQVAQGIPGVELDESTGVVTSLAPHGLLGCLAASGFQFHPESFGPPYDVAPRVLSELPEFQKTGASCAVTNLEQGFLLNDNPGLGKTVQTIGAMCLADPAVKKVVLCPSSLKTQWRDEVVRWTEKLTGEKPKTIPFVLYPKSDSRSRKWMGRDNPSFEKSASSGWFIAYYRDMTRVMELVEGHPYYLIVDEAHNLAGFGSQRWEAVNSVRTFASGALLLTASKMRNLGASLYTVLNLTQPGTWGSFGEWATRYAHGKQNDYGGWETGELDHIPELNARINAISIRRTAHDVWDQLPFSVRYQTIWLDPPPGIGRQLQGAIRGGLDAQAVHTRTIAMHKVPAVVEQIQSDTLSGRPSLTFTWLIDQARMIAAQVPHSLCITGEDDSSSRLDRIHAYVKKCKSLGKVPNVIATGGSTGTGGNLQEFKIVNIADLTYDPNDIEQWTRRAARMGQEGEVPVRIFGCKHSLDEHKIQVALKKLGEQEKLGDGKEVEKADLRLALSPKVNREALQGIWERWQKENRDGS